MKQHARYLAVFIAILVWFDAGQERLRIEKANIKSVEDVLMRLDRFLWPPWIAPLAFVSHNSDEQLFFEYSRMMLGEDADLPFIAEEQHGNYDDHLAGLRRLAAEHPGVKLPYRDLKIGFPPLAVAMILLPRLCSSSLPAYRAAFGALATLCYLLSWWLGYLLARRMNSGLTLGDVARRAIWVTLALGSIYTRRLDALPSLLALGALYTLATRRTLVAALLIIAGTLAKLFPILFVPVWLALLLGWGAPARRRLYVLVGGLGGVAVAGAVALLLTVGAAVAPLAAQLTLFGQRPFQIESTVGSLLLALRGGSGVVASYGSYNVGAPVWLSASWELVMLAAVAAIAFAAFLWARRHRGLDAAAETRALAYFSAATLVAILATSKVLSPQYLVWGVPLLALLPGASGHRIYRVFGWALALSQICYPIFCDLLHAGSLPVIAVLLVRNALLWVLLVLTLRAARAHPSAETQRPALASSESSPAATQSQARPS
jgi:hypothetical protein